MGIGDKIIVCRSTVFIFLHVCSGERRLRRISANILLLSSDEGSLDGGKCESYRRTPVGGSSPELATAPAAVPRPAPANGGFAGVRPTFCFPPPMREAWQEFGLKVTGVLRRPDPRRSWRSLQLLSSAPAAAPRPAPANGGFA